MSRVKERLDNKNYMIAVPSRKRSFMIRERKGIWRYVNPIEDYPVRLFLREEDMAEYRTVLPSSIQVYQCPNEFTIANKRQAVLETAIRNKVRYLFIIDDDVAFYYRDEELSSKYTSKMEIFMQGDCFNRILYEAIMLCNENAPIIGLPLKLGSFGLTRMFPKNIPIIRFVCYHVPTLEKENIKIDGMDAIFMSDRYVHLTLLKKGYYSLSNCGYAVGDLGTGYRGGGSTIRTVENQSHSAKELVKNFPGFVELKVKSNGLWDEERLDCKISWKKFLEEGELPYIPAEEGIALIEREGYICRK